MLFGLSSGTLQLTMGVLSCTPKIESSLKGFRTLCGPMLTENDIIKAVAASLRRSGYSIQRTATTVQRGSTSKPSAQESDGQS